MTAGRRAVVAAGLAAACGASEAAAARSGHALHEAAYQGDLAAVRRLVEAGADPNQRDMTPRSLGRGPLGRTPLLAAIRGGHPDVAAWLIAHGADVDLADFNGETPLSAAIDHGALGTVARLLGRGAVANPARANPDARPHSALVVAAEADNPEAVALLLRHGVAVNEAGWRRTTRGWGGAHPYRPTSPLAVAAGNARPEIVQRLIAAGADVNFVPRLGPRVGPTPLVAAVGRGRERNAELLLEAGADVNLPGADFMIGDEVPPLVVAVSERHLALIRRLVAARPSRAVIEAAIERARHNWNGVQPEDAGIIGMLQDARARTQ